MFDLIWVWLSVCLPVCVLQWHFCMAKTPCLFQILLQELSLPWRTESSLTGNQWVSRAADTDPNESPGELCGHIYHSSHAAGVLKTTYTMKKPQHQRLWLVLALQWECQCGDGSSSLYIEVMTQEREITASIAWRSQSLLGHPISFILQKSIPSTESEIYRECRSHQRENDHMVGFFF